MGRWKVGELARRTGLTVRTLHHYDQIGLLSPSLRTAAGHRLYGEVDVSRLQQVVSLRSLGLPLEEIRELLDRGASPLEVVRMHAGRLREQIQSQQRLLDRLDALADGLSQAEEVSADELLNTIEVMTMYEKYYTPEQMEQLRARGEALGPEGMRQAESDWQTLMDEVRAEMQKGTDPSDPRVQALARRWGELVHAFTGGDPGISQAVKKVWQQEENIQGIDTSEVRAMGEYIARAGAR